MTTTSGFDSSQWLTSEQVIERLVSDPVLRRRAATCTLPAVRDGDSWRFRKSDLEDWIRRQDAMETPAGDEE